MPANLSAMHSLNIQALDANRSNLVTAEVQQRSYTKTALTKTTGLVVDEVPIGASGDYTISLAGITTVNALYLKLTDDTKASIKLKLTSADGSDQFVNGRQFAFIDCAFTSIKIPKHATELKPIEYILSGV